MTPTKAYEALVILKTAGTEQDLARHGAQLEELIKRVGGRMVASQNMGRRKLAFRISRQTEGYYYLVRFQAPADHVAELERLLRLNEVVVRFMVLSADDVSTTQPVATTAAVAS